MMRKNFIIILITASLLGTLMVSQAVGADYN